MIKVNKICAVLKIGSNNYKLKRTIFKGCFSKYWVNQSKFYRPQIGI